MKRQVKRTAVAMGLAFCAGCGMHGVKHSAADESLPHYSWEIRSDRVSSDERMVCGSAEATPSCVLEAGSRITVHLAFHAADGPVTYSGDMTIPFVESVGGGGVRKVSADVRPGSQPVNTSVTGSASRTPGSYAFSIAMIAKQPGKPDRPLASDVKVVVR